MKKDAETTDTYPMTPPDRSVFSLGIDPKGHPVAQDIQSKSPSKLQPVNMKSK